VTGQPGRQPAGNPKWCFSTPPGPWKGCYSVSLQAPCVTPTQLLNHRAPQNQLWCHRSELVVFIPQDAAPNQPSLQSAAAVLSCTCMPASSLGSRNSLAKLDAVHPTLSQRTHTEIAQWGDAIIWGTSGAMVRELPPEGVCPITPPPPPVPQNQRDN
jgi:hypothetical protein